MSLPLSRLSLLALLGVTIMLQLLGSCRGFRMGRIVQRRPAALRFMSTAPTDPDQTLYKTAPTVKNLYDYAESLFRHRIISETEESARYIVCHATEIGYKYSQFQQSQRIVASEEQVKEFERMVQQRLEHMPVQYIIGNWGFFSDTVLCEPPILIPRAETENLIWEILKRKQWLKKPLRILEIGSGTGVIGITLLKHFTRATCLAIDINPAATKLSIKNADQILTPERRARYDAQAVSIEEFVKDRANHHQFDLIVSNPPYIATEEVFDLQKEVRCYEDLRALDGGADGLDVIRFIVNHAALLMSPHRLGEVWLEIARSQDKSLPAFIHSSPELMDSWHWTIMNDFSQLPRFARLRMKEKKIAQLKEQLGLTSSKSERLAEEPEDASQSM